MAAYYRRGRATAALTACLSALALAGCASNDATAPQATAPAPADASAKTEGGNVLPGQPDINGDGKVVIGVLSPGDINDKGYYQSFVDTADAFAAEKGWTIIKRGSVNTSEALNAARALCQQKVDMVALGASELRDAIPASEEPVCANTAWYVPSADNILQTPKIMLSTDRADQSMLAAGYAAGLIMKDNGDTKAGFVTGPEADFTVTASAAFKAGIRLVIPEATLTTTYSGDLNDSAKAKEATQAQISQGAKVIYPYLGGATDAAAELANANGVLTLTPGTDRCDSTKPKFDISVLFSPGDYFKAALEELAAAKLQMGVEKVWTLGVDPFPTVKICNGTPEQNEKLKAFIADVGSKKIDTTETVKRLGS
ncbi:MULTISPECIES: BMP family ABC transporter substrate-binding protein [unclassified Streptosporangium]|uniref:BMP family ABC transporter substrate-binding protein n=1 Tax=Streptosporangium sp. NPDC005286 TaxID=3154463 RepID=UPI0033B379FA